MEYIWIIISAILGILIGAIITSMIKRKNTSRGTLLIDLTDAERDIYRLILDEDLESLATQSRIELRVEVKENSHQ